MCHVISAFKKLQAIGEGLSSLLEFVLSSPVCSESGSNRLKSLRGLQSMVTVIFSNNALALLFLFWIIFHSAC
ncbi:hypothetical protein LIER_14288 [Lithospermum erythrorhizon]|uniref:Uncharacterized protein n=1 Tax=Lithospermum erythrorhizon TaxID=34254 RepID=A0AAV3PYM9_LITER